MVSKIVRVIFFWLGVSHITLAGATLQLTVADSDSPPIAVLEGKRLVGGLAKALGDALAQELNANVEYIVVPRARVGTLIEQRTFQVACNSNPTWHPLSTHLLWTKEIYPQVERLASLASMPDIHALQELKGLRISTIYGYSYPPILSHLWFTHQATRQQERRLGLMMKAVERKLADVAVVSELEFAYWAKQNPEAASLVKLHPIIVSSIPTRCAVSEYATFTVDQLNHAIDRLRSSGKLAAILRNYAWKPQGLSVTKEKTE